MVPALRTGPQSTPAGGLPPTRLLREQAPPHTYMWGPQAVL